MTASRTSGAPARTPGTTADSSASRTDTPRLAGAGGLRLELHLLQSLPPNNINRDDSGAPKDATFGGVRRARVSSQSWKRAMRTFTREQGLLPESQMAWRTKFVASLIRNQLQGLGVDSPLADGLAGRAVATLERAAVGAEMSAMFLISPGEAHSLAQAMADKLALFTPGTPEVSLDEAATWSEAGAGAAANKPARSARAARAAEAALSSSEDEPDSQSPDSENEEGASQNQGRDKGRGKDKGKDKGKPYAPFEGKAGRMIGEALKAVSSVEVALYGRMVASNPTAGSDGALQVAHALGTHAAPREFDYLTGMDDLRVGTGADMIDQVEFSSSVLYRYVCLDLSLLARTLAPGLESGELAELVRVAAEAVVRSAVLSMPSGKQRAFAANAAPGYVLAGVSRGGVALTLANAFLRPVDAGEAGDLMTSSVARLEEQFTRLQGAYAGASDWTLLNLTGRPSTLSAREMKSLTELAQSVTQSVTGPLSGPAAGASA